MDSSTKTYQQCGEQIKQTAKKCPYCQSWQKGASALLNNSPA